MAVWINFVCDEDGCRNCQSAGFDDLKETWQDMLSAISSAGWKITTENAKVIKAICPDHKENLCKGGCNNTGWIEGGTWLCDICDRACCCKEKDIHHCLIHRGW